MRVLTSQEVEAVAGGTFGLLWCLPKIKLNFFSWCKPAPKHCKPVRDCSPPPKCESTPPIN